MLLHVSPFISLKQGLHFIQLSNSGYFRQYDYFEENTAHYNSSEPPDYNISSITAPVYLYRGEQDYLVSKLVKKIVKNISKKQFKN